LANWRARSRMIKEIRKRGREEERKGEFVGEELEA
jgi:hypothetical protein